MIRFTLSAVAMLLLVGSLAGCAVVSGVATVASTAVSVTATAVETTADVVTAPLR